ncbi:hypothetical protein H633G_10575 [Metarhizium anisopliae BRIP 53284]|nr:hypothetical protein H633G_10575 [Metarhizium anisopliae BRIP 53284]
MCGIQKSTERCTKCGTDISNVEEKHWCQEALENGEFGKCKKRVDTTKVTFKSHESCEGTNIEAEAGFPMGSVFDDFNPLEEFSENMARHTDTFFRNNRSGRAGMEAWHELNRNAAREREALRERARERSRRWRDSLLLHDMSGKHTGSCEAGIDQAITKDGGVSEGL